MFKKCFKKVKNFFIIKDYFDGVLAEYNSIKEDVYHIETFQNDKLICNKQNQILIYNILEEKIILKKNIESDIHDCKIKVLPNNMICIFRRVRFSEQINYILLFEYKENKEKNEYSLKEYSKIQETANDILFQKHKIICFKNKCLNIYNLLKNEKYELQTVINLPESTTNYKGIILPNGNVGIFGYKKSKSIIFLSLKKYLQLMTDYSIINEKIFNEDIYYPDSIEVKIYNINKIIMFVGNIYLLYFNNNELKILNKIYCYKFIDNIHLTKKNEIYAFRKEFVYKLDLETKTFYKVSLEIKGNIKYLGILENEKKIFILKTKNENIKLCHLKKYNIIKHYLYYYLKLIFYLASFKALALGDWNIKLKLSSFIKSFIFLWILLKLGWGFKGSWIIILIIVIFAIRSVIKFSIKLFNDFIELTYYLFGELNDFINSIYYFFKEIILIINCIIYNILEDILK